jgi:hypothetical protein
LEAFNFFYDDEDFLRNAAIAIVKSGQNGAVEQPEGVMAVFFANLNGCIWIADTRNDVLQKGYWILNRLNDKFQPE